MVSIYDIKPAFQKLLQPVLQLCRALGLTANRITVLAIMLSFVGCVVLLLAQYVPVLLLGIPLVLFVRMALNALDGMMARQYNQASPLGAILNELGDVLSDVVLYLPLVLHVAPDAESMVLVFVIFGLLTEFCGVLTQALIGQRRYDGPMGKSDRAFLVGLYCIVLYAWPPAYTYASWIFLLANLMLLASCVNRLKPVLDHNLAKVKKGS